MIGLEAIDCWQKDDLAKTPSTQKVRSPAAPNVATTNHAASEPARLPSAQIGRQPSPPLPPADTPLASEFDELDARANAGDAAAASRLFRDIHRCVAAQDSQRMAAAIAPGVLERGTKKMDADEFAYQGSALDQVERLLALARRSADRCAGATRAQLDTLVPASLRAARFGDLHATNCYIGSMYTNMPGLLDHPEWLGQYKQYAPQLFEQGVRGGDWVSVELLRMTYAGESLGTPAEQTIATDDAMSYRYLRLERLGARDSARDLDNMLATARQSLTAAQIASGDAWARDTYARFFGATSSDTLSPEGPNICPLTHD